jgi:putative aldouronate transport system permease protein
MKKSLKKHRQLYLLLLPCVAFYIIFRYIPMYGAIIAFKDYGIFTGTANSPWVGFKWFEQFFQTA